MDENLDKPNLPDNSAPATEGIFSQVPIEVIISVGKAHPLVGELLQLGNNSVLTLDQRIDDPVELYVGNKLIARGELQELDGENSGQLAVRLTEVSDLKNGL